MSRTAVRNVIGSASSPPNLGVLGLLRALAEHWQQLADPSDDGLPGVLAHCDASDRAGAGSQAQYP
jgi:hypothetical protein